MIIADYAHDGAILGLEVLSSTRSMFDGAWVQTYGPRGDFGLRFSNDGEGATRFVVTHHDPRVILGFVGDPSVLCSVHWSHSPRSPGEGSEDAGLVEIDE